MFHLIIYAAIAGLVSLFSAALLRDVQQRVAAWLRQNGLKNSALMSAVVRLDSIGSAIRAGVKVVTRAQRTEVLMIERTYSINQIKDPELRAALQRTGHAEQDVITIFNTV